MSFFHKQLRGPVGIRNGRVQVVNLISDQNTVAGVLDLIPIAEGGNRKPDDSLDVVWPLPFRGKCHPVLHEHILKFQKTHPDEVTRADGVVDPSGHTYRAMISHGFRQIPTPQKKNAPKEQAEQALPTAQGWVGSALAYLGFYVGFLVTGQPAGFNLTPIETHFHISKMPLAERQGFAGQIIGMYTKILGFMTPENIQSATVDDLMKRSRCFGDAAPAFCGPSTPIMVSPTYMGLGLFCRAAILIHEASHHFGAGHINGESGSEYDNATPAQAITSAFVFPNFAEHTAPPQIDQRFGLARPTE